MVDAVEKYGCIVLLDALGTKGRWKKTGVLEILEKWELIVKSYKRRFQDRHDEYTNFSKITAFSDTIMIATAGEDPVKNFLATSIATSFLISEAVLQGIFFRGCINIGKYYWSELLLIGPAVDEAAQYYTLPEWIGVSTAPKAHLVLTNDPKEAIEAMQIPKNLFVKYDIPLKNTIEKNGFALNLPQAYEFVRSGGGKYSQEKYRDDIDTILKKQLDKIEDVIAALKIRNTLNFFNSIPKITANQITERVKNQKKS